MFIEHRVKLIIGSAIFEFCKREAGTDTELMKDWRIKKSIQHPQQTDNVNCGVFTLISSIRAMCFIKQYRFQQLLQNLELSSFRCAHHGISKEIRQDFVR